MKNNLKQLPEIDELSNDEQERLEQLLSDEDIARLQALSSQPKSEATLGTLSAVTRSGG